MSIEAFGAALNAEIENPAKKAVLIGLANHADPDGGNCRPSVKRLMAYTSLSESSVRTKLSELRDDGLIRISRKSQQHRPTVYWLNIQALIDLKHPLILELENNPTYTGVRPPATAGLDTPDLQLPESRPPATGGKPSLEPSSKVHADEKLSAGEIETELVRKMSFLFAEISDVPWPKPETASGWKAAKKLWLIPLRQIAKTVDFHEKRSLWLVERAIVDMREEGLRITDPNSILRVAIGIYAEAKAGVYGKKKEKNGFVPTGTINVEDL